MKGEIRVAKSAGFCFGVKRAVDIAEKCIAKGNAAALGELIHNSDFVNRLTEMGLRTINSPSEAHSGENVVIRSHGVPDSVYAELTRRGAVTADGTCPFVKKIHDIVRERSSEGCTVIIIGSREHPEVAGIAGSCVSEPVILPDENALREYLLKNYENSAKTIAIVVQTTYNINKWVMCKKVAAGYDRCVTYDTVCSASADRQSEAARLAEWADVMIVVGGRHSSNTVKLYEICSGFCPRTFFIENARETDLIGELKRFSDKSNIRLGITAGASVPAYIIKEVYNQMSEILQNDENFNFEEAIDASLKRLHNGDRVKGCITAVNKTEAIVDIGAKQTGYVSLDELTDGPAAKVEDIVNVGDELDFIILKVNDAEGYVTLSKKRLDARAGFEKIVAAKEEGTVLDGVVTDVIKGGVLAAVNGINGIKVFIPASQTNVRRDEKLDDLKKKEVKFRIIEVNEIKGKAVGSIKAVLSAERDAAKEKFWETAAVGDKFKGEVKSLTSYGAFVDLGGIDGMVHISELSWNRIKNPAEVVSVGDVLEVYIKDLDREANRISLGYKKAEDDPFVKFTTEYQTGDVVDTKIVSITPFGAFAQIIPGIDGLIHISQLSDKRVENVKDVVSVGDTVKVKITEIDAGKKRISLSMRALLENNSEADGDAE